MPADETQHQLFVRLSAPVPADRTQVNNRIYFVLCFSSGCSSRLTIKILGTAASRRPLAEILLRISLSLRVFMEVFNNYIEIQSDKRFGQPCIKGTRISVYDILSMLASGMASSDILEDFPELTGDHIRAALQFAANREHNLRIAS